MFTIEYKRLFELRIIHDYYLIDRSGQSAFAESAAERHARLERQIQAGRYGIGRDLAFLLNEEEQKKFRDYRLKLVPTPMGFYVGMEVRSEAAPGGGRRYRPFIGPPEDEHLTFGLSALNPLFGNITSMRTELDDGLLYYFSNEGERVAGTLSSPAPEVEDGEDYQMGDIGLFGGNLSQAVEDNQGAATSWQELADVEDGLVHQGDRVLSEEGGWYQDWKLAFKRPPDPHFGLARVFFQPAAPGFRLIDEDGYLVTTLAAGETRPAHPVFELRFLSRWTYWRYQRKGGLEAAEVASILGAISGTVAQGPDRVMTSAPRYLAQSLTGFTPIVGTDLLFFTNPAPMLLSKEQGRVYSDVFFTRVNPIPV
jgi:hypothetical protein